MRLGISNVEQFYFSFLLWFLPSLFGSSLRGVDPAVVSHYHHEVFSCFDGSTTIRLESINDDFCDCMDGSDEPGTSACPSGSFYCKNIGFEPRRIPSSFVDDGICDCCDGSDEALTSCEDSCPQLGQQRRAELLKETEQYQAALQEKKNRLGGMDNVMQKWKKELEEVQEDVKKQQEKCNALKDQLDNLEAEKRRIADEKAAKNPTNLTTENDTLIANQTQDSNSQDKTNEDQDPAKKEDSKSEEIITKESGTKVEEESEETKSEDDFVEEEDDSGLDQELLTDSTSTTVKTDDADSYSINTVNEADLDLDDDAYNDEEDHDDDDSEIQETQQEQDSKPFKERMISFLTPLWQRLKSLFRRSGSKRAEQDPGQMELNRVRKEHSQQRRELITLERKVKDIEKKLENDYGPNSTFLSLVDQCFELKEDKYTYEICPFEKANQKEGRNSVSLGDWSGFDENYKSMKFERGQRCGHGRNRKLDVYLICGVEDKVLTVTEPDVCEYSANFSTPTICLESELQELTNRVQQFEKLQFEKVQFDAKDEL